MRIIAGVAKGVPLAAPGGPSNLTRPTTDRVREAVFSVLADWAGTAGGPAEEQLAGLTFLDLFAGSGALAIEAMSRGAARAVAVDSGSAAVAAIRANAQATGLRVEAVRAFVTDFLKKTEPAPFDIVWLDPPYQMTGAVVDDALRLLMSGWVGPGGLVAVERSARDEGPNWPVGLMQRFSKRYGETIVHFAEEATP